MKIYYIAIISCLFLVSCKSEKGKTIEKNAPFFPISNLARMDKNTFKDKQQFVDEKNWNDSPYNSWAYTHSPALYPTLRIPSITNPSALSFKLNDSLDEKIITLKGKEYLFKDFLDYEHIDSIIISKKQKIIYEAYLNPFMDKNTIHNWFTIEFSLSALLVNQAAFEKKIDLNNSIATYIPELKGSGYERATIQNILDMKAAVYPPDNTYFQKAMESYDYQYPIDAKQTAHRFLMSFKTFPKNVLPDPKYEKMGVFNMLPLFIENQKLVPGKKREPLTANNYVLIWLLNKVYQKPYNEIIFDKIWSKLGVDQSMYIISDRLNQGMSNPASTTRDLFRYALLLDNKGTYNGKTIFNKKVIENLFTLPEEKEDLIVSDVQNYTAPIYHNLWWNTSEDNDILYMRGSYNQMIYFNKKEDVIVVLFGSEKDYSNLQKEIDLLFFLKTLSTSL